MSSVQTFVIYNCTVAIKAVDTPARPTIVPKEKLTAPEIAILAGIHDIDAINPEHLVVAGTRTARTVALRKELEDRYNTTNTNGRLILQGLYGAVGMLPEYISQAIPGMEEPTSEVQAPVHLIDEDAEAPAPAKTGKALQFEDAPKSAAKTGTR